MSDTGTTALSPEEVKAKRREESEAAVRAIVDETVDSKTGEIVKGMEAFANRMGEWEKSMVAHSEKMSLPGSEDAVEKGLFSLPRLIVALKRGNVEQHAPAEYDYIKELHKKCGNDEVEKLKALDYMLKTQTMGSDAAGGYLVAEQLSSEYIEDLRDKPKLLQHGARMITGLKAGTFKMPKKTGSSTVEHVAEGTAPSASSITFGQEVMTPHRAKSLVRLSNDLEMMSNLDVQGIIKDDILSNFALDMDSMGLRGTGSSNEPLGIANQPSGLNTVDASAGAITLAMLNLFSEYIEQDKALMEDGNFAFGFNPRTIAVVRKFVGSVNTEYLFRPDTWEFAKPTLLGYPYFITSQIPNNVTVGAVSDCAEVYFGNWKELIYGVWGGLELQAFSQVNLSSTDAAALMDEVWVYCVMRYDCMVRHAESFSFMSDTTS